MFNFLGKTKKQKIFCISIQRTGTTSVGDFFEKHNYRRAGWYHSKENNWGKLYFDGNYEAIFSSMDFKNNDVFEDGPESIGHFYKYLFEVDMEVKHEALYDTQKCLECYIELRKRSKKKINIIIFSTAGVSMLIFITTHY